MWACGLSPIFCVASATLSPTCQECGTTPSVAWPAFTSADNEAGDLDGMYIYQPFYHGKSRKQFPHTVSSTILAQIIALIISESARMMVKWVA